MALNLESNIHAHACSLICIGCLRKVNTVLCGSVTSNSRDRTPNIYDSLPLTEYLCKLAFIRWEITWEISSLIFPNRICTKCRLTLTKDPLNIRFPIQLHSPSRLHTSATTWIVGDCSLCDIAFQKGRKPKRRNTNCPKNGRCKYICIDMQELWG